jgi:hypothetical protein
MLIAGLAACGFLFGDPEETITHVVSQLASALSENNPQSFLKSLDKSIAEYGRIERDVNALAGDTLVSCSIEVLAIRGSEADLDWYMVLRSKQDENLIERRRTKVTIRVDGKGRVTAFSPVTIFVPLKLR